MTHSHQNAQPRTTTTYSTAAVITDKNGIPKQVNLGKSVAFHACAPHRKKTKRLPGTVNSDPAPRHRIQTKVPPDIYS